MSRRGANKGAAPRRIHPSAWIFSIQRSNGGVPKLAVQEARVTALGLEGDRQRDLKHHGGPERAVCLYGLDQITALQREGHPVFPGSLGENVTIAGLDWASVAPGTRLRLGGVLLLVMSYAAPCRTIAGSFSDGRYTRTSHKTHPASSRVYACVLEEGVIRVSDEVTVETLAPTPPPSDP